MVYQLHDYGQQCSSWLRHSCIERYAFEQDLLVVLPEGGKGYYTDAVCGHFNYESHLLETISFVDQHFNTVNHRAGRGIGGMGMGGYGALKLGLKHREQFSVIAVHSAQIDIAGLLAQNNALTGIFGDTLAPDDDLGTLLKQKSRMPRLYVDCGTKDAFADENRAFHDLLKERDITHRYAEFPGGHSWAYWEAHLLEALAFQAQHL